MTHADHAKRRAPRVQRQPRRDAADAFIPESSPHTDDTLAENLAEEFLESATSGEERGEEALNELVSEEIGGPFVEVDSAPQPDDVGPRSREPGRRTRQKRR